MAIEFLCSQCQAELRVEPKDVGKKARCPRCGMIHEVPKDAVDSVTKRSEEQHVEQHVEEDVARDHQTTVYRPAISTGESLDTALASPQAHWSMKTPDGSVYGPVDRTELDQWSVEGRISSQCLLRLEGNSHWQSAISVYPDLTGLRLAPSATASTAVSGSGRRGGAGPAGTHGGIYQRANRGLVICMFAIFAFFFSVVPPFNVIAFVWAKREKSAIDARRIDPRQRFFLDIAMALSVLGMCVSALMIIGCMM